jgi:GNAT superfamily N-acetyltransferase
MHALAFMGTRSSAISVTTLSVTDVDEIVDVLSDAFYDYPVMRYVLGRAQPYDARLRKLVELFVSRRAYPGEPMLGVRDATGALVAAATVAVPSLQDPPAPFLALRDSVWSELGADALGRYDAFATTAQQFAIEAPHYYLDMIGVRRSHQGRGLARVLLEAVHDLSRSDDVSSGVRLTTEHAPNVPFYEHFGYRVQGHGQIGDGLETWTLFRADKARDGASVPRG